MDEAQRNAIGANGRKLVEERYTWPTVAARMKEVYDWLLGGGAPPACVRLD
jgi:glycosyltransferase involved in cell wall biosynthesis